MFKYILILASHDCIRLWDVTCSLIRDFNFNDRFPNKFEINFFLDEDIETWFSSYE